MAITHTDNVVHLTDICGSDDAAPLLDWLLQHPAGTVNLTECVQLHTAALQVLMTLSPLIIGPPKNERLARWLPLHLTEKTEKTEKQKKQEKPEQRKKRKRKKKKVKKIKGKKVKKTKRKKKKKQSS
ncbi:MAG: hypothetical protein D3910_29070 [Candidatus Electrothrix sp. ATG2]|nr:hypothetical protein [Candidatus Electrothrix sp. ATG2]